MSKIIVVEYQKRFFVFWYSTTIIHVEDNCGGIPENEKPFLFDPSKSRKKGGTGLGLAISKQLALSMDAELSLKKSDEHGSVFSISFVKSTA